GTAREPGTGRALGIDEGVAHFVDSRVGDAGHAQDQLARVAVSDLADGGGVQRGRGAVPKGVRNFFSKSKSNFHPVQAIRRLTGDGSSYLLSMLFASKGIGRPVNRFRFRFRWR